MNRLQKSMESGPSFEGQVASFGKLAEDEQIAMLIKLFELPPVVGTSKAIWIIGETRTDYYSLQNIHDAKFDAKFPLPIGGRRSQRSSRRFWTIDLLRWRIQLANSGNR